MMKRPFFLRSAPALLLLLAAASCSPDRSPAAETPRDDAAVQAQATSPAESAAAPGSSTHSELRTSLLELFSGYEHQPTEAELRGLADPASVVDELIAMLADPTTRSYQRLHALRALHVFAGDDARVMATYGDMLASDDLPDRELHATLRSLATGLVRAQRPDDALPHLEPWLHSEDYSTRATAIAAITELGTPRAHSALERHGEREHDPQLRATVEGALAAPQGSEVLR